MGMGERKGVKALNSFLRVKNIKEGELKEDKSSSLNTFFSF
jgi:hypothetical protein